MHFCSADKLSQLIKLDFKITIINIINNIKSKIFLLYRNLLNGVFKKIVAVKIQKVTINNS
jgi:hypothetical protein